MPMGPLRPPTEPETDLVENLRAAREASDPTTVDTHYARARAAAALAAIQNTPRRRPTK